MRLHCSLPGALLAYASQLPAKVADIQHAIPMPLRTRQRPAVAASAFPTPRQLSTHCSAPCRRTRLSETMQPAPAAVF
jgi:hypothetical protein